MLHEEEQCSFKRKMITHIFIVQTNIGKGNWNGFRRIVETTLETKHGIHFKALEFVFFIIILTQFPNKMHFKIILNRNRYFEYASEPVLVPFTRGAATKKLTNQIAG